MRDGSLNPPQLFISTNVVEYVWIKAIKVLL